jgi:hypothetical protein
MLHDLTIKPAKSFIGKAYLYFSLRLMRLQVELATSNILRAMLRQLR